MNFYIILFFNLNLQNTLYSVEALMKNHDRFERLMEKQVEQVEDVREFADKLASQNHYAWDEIRDRRQAVDDRFSRLKESSDARQRKLGDSKNYQLYLRNIYDVSDLFSYNIMHYKRIIFLFA